MPGYEVVIEALRDSARAAAGASDELRAVDPAAVLRGGAQAMPGAHSVSKIDAVRQMWKGRGKALSTEFDDYANALASAADLYERSDERAKAELEAPHPVSGPVQAY